MRRLRLFQATQAKAVYLGTCFLLVGFGFIPAPVARGDTPEFPTEPVLRLNPEVHTAPIRRISVDKRGRYVATGSDDKTVRVWDLETGRLEQVLRVPLGPGHLGKVAAVALSPDARQVAVSGFTGVWKEYRNITETKRRETIDQLESLKWKPFAQLAGAQ